MTKKTLSASPLSERTEAPPLQKRGRGWTIADKRLDQVHAMARANKGAPTPAQAALAEKLGQQELGKYKLHRQVVIGSAIVDFACQPLKLAVSIDEGGDPALVQRRDLSLGAVGIQVLRFTAADVVTRIIATMKARYDERRARGRARPERRPERQGYGR
jgi:very-short-patch-repair endonuclease